MLNMKNKQMTGRGLTATTYFCPRKARARKILGVAASTDGMARIYDLVYWFLRLISRIGRIGTMLLRRRRLTMLTLL